MPLPEDAENRKSMPLIRTFGNNTIQLKMKKKAKKKRWESFPAIFEEVTVHSVFRGWVGRWKGVLITGTVGSTPATLPPNLCH